MFCCIIGLGNRFICVLDVGEVISSPQGWENLGEASVHVHARLHRYSW